ncbi:tail fiber protein [Asticcacaulis sp.]|uniref:phage tail protein n=1 Tax=Asticcacaulis sp. TaxID=1872648 RepID=UPI00261BEC17|nr:tail fiber protein [Asticcacaulis sp.]
MDAFIGEVRAFPYSFVPQGWLECTGQELAVSQFQILYAVIGNTWGGTANTSFKLPNLQGIAVMGQGTGPGLTTRIWSKSVGVTSVALTSSNQGPPHSHPLVVQDPVNAGIQANTLSTPVANSSWLAQPNVVTGPNTAQTPASYQTYTGQSLTTPLNPNIIGPAGGAPGGGVSSHENRQPYLTLVYCINYNGTFPMRN